MLTFLRKIRKSLIESGSARKYLLYAIGEILLVMIGILLALQINNWNEWRKDRSNEREVLEEIRDNIDLNSQRFLQEIGEEESVVHSIDIVLSNLIHQKVYHDSLDFHFMNAGYWPALVIKTSGYQALKSQGIELIWSKALRQAIVDLYEGAYIEIEEIIRNSENNAAGILAPIFTDLFYMTETTPNTKFNENKRTPTNYTELIESQKFKNVLSAWRHARVASIQLRFGAIEKNERIILKINRYIEDN